MSVALYLNGTEIPLTRGSYTEKYSHYEVVEQTEAGTNRRDLIRANILGLSVSLTASTSDKEALRAYSAQSSLTVKYYKGSTLTTWTAYMENFSANLLTDGEWDVSFDLVDMEQ